MTNQSTHRGVDFLSNGGPGPDAARVANASVDNSSAAPNLLRERRCDMNWLHRESKSAAYFLTPRVPGAPAVTGFASHGSTDRRPGRGLLYIRLVVGCGVFGEFAKSRRA